MIQHVGYFGFIGSIEPVGRALARLRHPHVERAIRLEGKAAVGPVELHRRHADVEDDAVDRLDPALGKQPVDLAEASLYQLQAAIGLFD